MEPAFSFHSKKNSSLRTTNENLFYLPFFSVLSQLKDFSFGWNRFSLCASWFCSEVFIESGYFIYLRKLMNSKRFRIESSYQLILVIAFVRKYRWVNNGWKVFTLKWYITKETSIAEYRALKCIITNKNWYIANE